jgi:hypothetical protein
VTSGAFVMHAAARADHPTKEAAMAKDDDTEHDEKDDEKDPGKGSEKETEDGVPPAVKAALRKANKEAETLRLKLKELEDRDKSETDKLQDRVTVAEKRAEEAEARALRLEVAAEKGLTLTQAKRLVGSTKDELEADADELLESFGGAAGGNPDNGGRKPPPGKPKEKLRPGHVPDATEEADADKVADLVFKQSRGGL